jgi:acyl-CoA thioesterase-2
VAATRTVDPNLVPHSLHSYFLLPGDAYTPYIYTVERLRDGRSFAQRRVIARQRGQAVFHM